MKKAARGFTLIELAVTLVILGILMMYGIQSYSEWIANTRLRTTAEILSEGLSRARNEAIKRNRLVSIYLVDNLSSGCALSASGTSWVVGLTSPVGGCDVAVSDTVTPFIVDKRSGTEMTSGVTVAATSSTGAAATTVVFNGLGRMVTTGTTPITQINIDSSTLAASKSRDLRIVLTTGGMIKMCDPSITVTTDPRKC